MSKHLVQVTLNPVLTYWILHKVFSFTYLSNLVYHCFLMGCLYLFIFWSLGNSNNVIKPSFCIFITITVLLTSFLRYWCWTLKFTWKIVFLISLYLHFFQMLTETCSNLFKSFMFFIMFFQPRTLRLFQFFSNQTLAYCITSDYFLRIQSLS